LCEHLGDNVLLADVALGNVLDCHAGLGRQRHRTLTNPVSQLHRELRIVEDADRVGMKETRHPLRVANHRHRASDHHSIVAGQHAPDPLVVALRQRLGHAAPAR
jgi:type II secretory pathway predicted ATPase ExeA